jgi:thiamine-monophosphate kinase
VAEPAASWATNRAARCSIDGHGKAKVAPKIQPLTLSPSANLNHCRTAWDASARSSIFASLPLREKTIIARIRHAAAKQPAKYAALGIGDDCALLRVPPAQEILATTDFSIEGIHFRRDWHPPESVGHRCLARGLSDIAAMEGEPIAALLSLAVPAKLPQRWVDRFLRGLLQLGEKFGVPLVGGDTSQSKVGILADIVVLGTVPQGKAILRSGARAGDRIYVTGEVGGSAATLDLLLSGRKIRAADYPAHFYPEPRIHVARFLREKDLASAMIDLSDGLSTDLAHICEESGVGAQIRSEAIPKASIGKNQQEVELAFALHGGEDYELLFCAPRGRRVPPRIAGVPVTEIGVIERGQHITLQRPGGSLELRPQGWEHFKR